MIPAIRSEIRKLFSVRSTYVIMLVVLAMLGLFAFYIEGIRAGASANNPGKLASEVVGAAVTTGVLLMIAGALTMTHEYRYNTIMYTLTASRGRLRVLLAKILVVSVFSVLFALVVGALSPMLALLGISVKGLTLVPQTIPVLDLMWRVAFAGWAYGMLGLLLATLIRNQVGTIVSILFIPTTVEALVGMLLKNNAMYLPFNALNTVIQGTSPVSRGLSYDKAALVVLAYILVGWAIAFILFRRRDAN